MPEVVTLVARGEVITQDRNHDPIAASLQSRTSIIRQRPVGSHQSSVGNMFLNFMFTISKKDCESISANKMLLLGIRRAAPFFSSCVIILRQGAKFALTPIISL